MKINDKDYLVADDFNLKITLKILKVCENTMKQKIILRGVWLSSG